MRFTIHALTGCLLLLLLSACNNQDEPEMRSVSNSINKYEASKSFEDATKNTLEWREILDFFYTQDGLDFKAMANRLAMAWLRHDREILYRYVIDAEYQFRVAEEHGFFEVEITRADELDYMFFLIPHPTYMLDFGKNGNYHVIFRYRLIGWDTVAFIEMTLTKTEEGWRALWLIEQG
jgi:hypothetical protein